MSNIITPYATQTLRGIDASQRDETVMGTSGSDTFLVLGSVTAKNGYTATIDMLEGSDAFRVYGSMLAEEGLIYLSFSGATNIVTVASDVTASNSGSVQIYGLSTGSDAGDNTISIGGSLTVVDMGSAYIYLEGGNNSVSIEDDLSSSGRGITMTMGGEEEGPSDSVSSLTIGGDLSTTGHNLLIFNDAENHLAVHGRIEAADGGFNWLGFWVPGTKGVISVAEGLFATEAGDNYFNIMSEAEITLGGMTATDEGINRITGDALGEGAIEIYVEGDLYAAEGGTNRINIAGAHSATVEISGDLVASNGGKNIISLWNSSSNLVAIDGTLSSVDNGMNEIILGNGGNTVYLNGGMEALASISEANMIQSGAGDDVFYLKGAFSSAPAVAANHFNAGAGNDHLFIDGQVSERGLNVSDGGGYDVLTLGAASTTALASNYQAWLEYKPQASHTGFYNIWGIECIRVALEDTQNLASLSWLDTLVQNNYSYMEFELNVDALGQSLSLGTFFAGRTDDIFTGIDMSGEEQNTLTVSGSLASNNISAYFFKISGDGEDTVQLSSGWMYIGDEDTDAGNYSYYTTGFDLLMIESEVTVAGLMSASDSLPAA